MEFAKKWFWAILVFFVSSLLIILPVFAFNFFGFNTDDNYTDFSEVDTKRIIGAVSGTLENQWTKSFVSGVSPQESTAISFLRQASIFDYWNYTLADLPADAIVGVLKIVINDAFSENKKDVVKILLEKIEKLSVNEAVRVAKEELNLNKNKVAFGAMRGTNSKDNKEVIFQYVIVYQSTDGNNGNMTIRFYSPKEILPPQSKASYGLALGFINSLENNEKLPPFIFELKGEVKEYLMGNYKFVSPVETKISFSGNVPDLALVPSSWKERYIFSPMEEIIKNIPIIGNFLNKSESAEFLSGSGDEQEIKKEISNVFENKPIADAVVSSSSKNDENSLKSEKVDKEKPVLKKSEKTNKISKKTVNNSNKKIKKTEDPIIKKDELDINNLSKEEKNKFLILALQEYSELLLEQERAVKKAEEKDKKEKEAEIKRAIKEKEKQEKIILVAEKEEKISKKCPRDNYGQNKRETIVFNEFAWMGDKEDSSHEWIELKNIGSKSVNIEGWKIYSKNNKKDIIFEESYFIDPGGFVLLERSEKSVPNIKADLIFSDSLSNSNEKFLLYDSDCVLHDTVIADPVWPAGNNSEKRTMEMAGDYTWHTYSGYGNDGIFGTPKAENSKYDYYVEERVQRTKTSAGSSSGSISSAGSSSKANETVSYCNQENLGSVVLSPIIINEVSWMGTSNSSSDEWVELRNITNEEVSLNGWQLLDKNNDIKISFGVNEKIEANGFYLLERTDDNSVLNISADKIYSGSLSDKDESLRLFNSACNLIDEVIADSDWPAGNSKDKKTMERIVDLKDWQTYSDDSSDNISGLFGTPNRKNSGIDNGEEGNDEERDENDNNDDNGEDDNNENDNNNDDNNENDSPEGFLKEKAISNFSVVSGNLKNQVILEWDKIINASNYEIFYSLENNIDENNLIKIDEYAIPEIVENDNKIKAIISDLYFGKKYYFAVRAKNSEEDFSLLSEKIEKITEESSPILASKYGKYDNSHKYDFSGPVRFSNAEQINKIMELPMEYSGHIVVDANSNMYLFAKIGEKTGIYCFDPFGSLRWFFPAQGGDPFIGQDGTIYFNNTSYLFALSPSGKLKWKELFTMILSKDPLLDKEGNIFMMVIDSDDSRPDLFMVKDLGYGISRETIVLSSQLLGEKSLLSYSELAMNDEGEIYLGLSNKLIKYKYGQGIIDSKTFVAQCSPSYSDSCDSYLPSIVTISIAQNGNIYVFLKNTLIGESANFDGVYALDSSNISGDHLWYINNATLSAINQDSVFVYGIVSSIFSQGSWIISFDANTGIEKWRKEWNDPVQKSVVFVDNEDIVYVKNNKQLIGYDSKNISNKNPLEDIIYQIDTNEERLKISVSENDVYFVGKNISKVSK